MEGLSNELSGGSAPKRRGEQGEGSGGGLERPERRDHLPRAEDRRRGSCESLREECHALVRAFRIADQSAWRLAKNIDVLRVMFGETKFQGSAH